MDGVHLCQSTLPSLLTLPSAPAVHLHTRSQGQSARVLTKYRQTAGGSGPASWPDKASQAPDHCHNIALSFSHFSHKLHVDTQVVLYIFNLKGPLTDRTNQTMLVPGFAVPLCLNIQFSTACLRLKDCGRVVQGVTGVRGQRCGFSRVSQRNTFLHSIHTEQPRRVNTTTTTKTQTRCRKSIIKDYRIFKKKKLQRCHGL